jgi:hypothetical protein
MKQLRSCHKDLLAGLLGFSNWEIWEQHQEISLTWTLSNWLVRLVARSLRSGSPPSTAQSFDEPPLWTFPHPSCDLLTDCAWSEIDRNHNQSSPHQASFQIATGLRSVRTKSFPDASQTTPFHNPFLLHTKGLSQWTQHTPAWSQWPTVVHQP